MECSRSEFKVNSDFFWNKTDGSKKEVRIATIESAGIRYVHPIGKYTFNDGVSAVVVSEDIVPFSEIEPILITEEWLVGLGFSMFRGLYYKKHIKDGWMIYYDTIDAVVQIDTGLNTLNLTHIKHVHQLQNLYYALTQEELTYASN